LGFRVSGLLKVHDCAISGLGFRASGLLKVHDCAISGLGFRALGSFEDTRLCHFGFRV
jgi:hypothetical protein